MPALRTGDLVEVRSLDEVLATLDDRARLEALPFMPEMLKFVATGDASMRNFRGDFALPRERTRPAIG